VEVVVAGDCRRRPVVRRNGRRWDVDLCRRADREVRDLHHRAVVDRKHEAVTDPELVVEEMRDERGAVPAEDRDLRVAVRRGRDSRNGGTEIPINEVLALHVLERVRVRPSSDAVVIHAAVDRLEVADVECHEAAEA
jgi:hypothetical protein